MGLMGQIAHTVYAGLGEESVIGVIPEALQPREVPAAVDEHESLIQGMQGKLTYMCAVQISGETVGEIRVVPDMHTRKVNDAVVLAIPK